MENAKLKVLATSYDANGEMSGFAIGIGTKWIGSVNRAGRFFEAKIGPARGKGLTPDQAARQAWIAFCRWQPPVYGMVRPGSADLEKDRITLRTVGTTGFDVFVGGEPAGEVIKLRDGRYRAMVRGSEKTGVCAMAAARLAWLKKLDGDVKSRDG